MHKDTKVVADICAASRAAGLVARPDIAKCAGSLDHIAARCRSCVRVLAPEGEGQQWVVPTIKGGDCSHYAALGRYKQLFAGPAAANAGRGL